MSNSIFDALTGVTLEGSAGLTVQQLLDAPDLIQSTVTIAGGSPTATSTSHQCAQLSSAITNATISEGVSLDDDDVFQCGRCKKQFSSLDIFMVHKRDHCSSKNGVVHTLQATQGPPHSSPTDHGSFESENPSLAGQIHLQVQPQQTQVSTAYSSGGLPSPGTIIVNEAELLPFTIETAQVLPLPGGLQTANFLPVSSSNKTLSSAVSPLLTTTTTITTPLDVGSNLASPQTLTTMVDVDGSEGGEGCNDEDPDHEEMSEERDDIACYNHEFFHGGMAKTAPSKNEPLKLKPKHRCPFCAKEFSKNFDLQQHIRSHTGEKPFQCIVCGRAFTQKSNVKKHMATHRVWPSGSLSDTLPKDPIKKLMMSSSTIDMVPQIDLLEEGVLKEEVLVDDSYVCQFCGHSLDSYVELRTHMKLHAHQKVYKCIQKNCDLAFDDLDSFLDHIRTHDRDLQYRCHTCSKVFSSLNTLGYHQYEHSVYPQSKKAIGPSYFRCTKCMNKYASAEALEHHLRTSSHHYPCKQCGKIFTSERLLRRHLHVHGTVNLFTCAQCSKEFKSEYSLKLHQLIHTGEKPFECHLCKTAFNRRDKLKRHMLIHEAKKFKCPFRSTVGCQKEFSRPDKLRLHMMTHAGGRARRGRGRGRSSSTARIDRQVKTEVLTPEESNCSICHHSFQHEGDHMCFIEENEDNGMVGCESRDPAAPVSQAGRIRPVRQAVVRRARDQANSRRGGRKKRGGCGHHTQQPHRQNQQQELQEKHTVQSQEIQHQVEESILGVPAVDCITELKCDADTQNVEIIYIPFSLPLTRPIQAELMRAMSSEEGGHVDSDLLEGGPTITLDGTTSSLLVGNSTMVPLVNHASVHEMDHLEPTNILKETTDLQVIYNSATTQQESNDASQLVETQLTSNHLHGGQLGHDATLDESRLTHSHLTHLNILPDQT